MENWTFKLMQRNYEVCLQAIENKLKALLRLLIQMQDPILKQRIIKLIVDVSSKALDKAPSFALKVLEYILMTRLPDQPEFPAYSEAVKELHGLASHELRRLAMRYADYFSVRTLQMVLS